MLCRPQSLISFYQFIKIAAWVVEQGQLAVLKFFKELVPDYFLKAVVAVALVREMDAQYTFATSITFGAFNYGRNPSML